MFSAGAGAAYRPAGVETNVHAVGFSLLCYKRRQNDRIMMGLRFLSAQLTRSVSHCADRKIALAFRILRYPGVFHNANSGTPLPGIAFSATNIPCAIHHSDPAPA